MIIGIILVFLAIISYLLNIFLIKYFINKKFPGLLEADMTLPKPKKNEEYLWEKTVGAGVVPKWVSTLGLLPYPLILIGAIFIIVSIIS